MDWLLYIFLGFLTLSLIATAIVAYRYRKYLQTGWLMFKTYRQFRQKTKPNQKNIETNSTPSNSPLARCPKCGKWTPQDEAVKIKSNYYCSHRCMEESFQTAR